MSESTESIRHIPLDDVQSILAEHGYEVGREDDHLRVRDPDNGIVIRTVLEDDILFSSVVLTAMDDASVTPEVARRMLDGDNGITTSFFQLHRTPGEGRTAVTLNNFCKLQRLGADDVDDMLACLEFLEIDAYAARALLSDVVGGRQEEG